MVNSVAEAGVERTRKKDLENVSETGSGRKFREGGDQRSAEASLRIEIKFM
jgi:hypothetical protein